MGFIGDLFSPSSEEIAPSAPLITQAERLTPGQRDLLDQLTTLLGGELGAGAEAFPGQLTAGVSPLQEQTFDLGKILTGGGGPFQAGLGALGDVLAPFDRGSTEEFFAQAIEAPALERFEKDIIPAIQGSFAARNMGSSSGLNRALAREGGRLNTSLTSELANLLFQTEGRQQQRQLGGLGAALGLPLEAGQQLGGTQRGIEQQGLEAILNEFLRTQPEANPFLNLLPTGLGTPAFENIVQGSTILQGPSPLSQIASMFAGIGGEKGFFG